MDPHIRGILGEKDITVEFIESLIARASETDADVPAAVRLMPGFIDMHCHGAVGFDVNTADADGLERIGRFLASKGVTAWLPTIVPDSDDAYERVIDAVNEAVARQENIPIAQIAGVHYEGLWASERMCGALHPQYFRSADDPSNLPRPEQGVVMTTLAPEIGGGIELIRRLRDLGWIVSIGHTQADADILEQAFDAGARHLTHFFNAMTGIHHRELGVAGWGLAKDGVTFDIIADGVHVHPSIVSIACRAKGGAGVSLISDSVAPTGLGDGEFKLWGETITVTDGSTRNERGSIAGSVITMYDAVIRMLELGFDFSEAAAMAASNPASVLGLEAERGAIAAGKRADIVLLNDDRSIAAVYIGGQLAA